MESIVIEKTKTVSRCSKLVPLIAYASVIGILPLFAVGILNRSAQPVESGAAPQFSIPLYNSNDTFSLADQRGKIVVVNFWASWCIPCRQEAPMLERVWKRYKERGVVFIGVDYVDTETEAIKFIQEFGITYPNGPDMGTEPSHRYRIQGVPETYFVGKDGNLSGNYIGPFGSEAALTSTLNELLKK